MKNMNSSQSRKTQNMINRVSAMVMALLFAFTFACDSRYKIYAEEDTSDVNPSVRTDYEIFGSNSFGNLVASGFAEKNTEQLENNGFNVFSVEMIDTVAAVSFETTRDCTLLVGIYDNEGRALLTYGTAEVIAEETEAYIDINADAMPDYFYIKAYLIDTDTLRPLCAEYTSPMYTRNMQDFLSKTAGDFDPNRVMNLDNREDTNFAVFNETTKLIPTVENVNEIVSADPETQTYVFKNADENITSLKAGDIFAYNYNDEVLIVKVGSISIDGSNVTIIGQDTELDEVFEHLRIDGEAPTESAITDASELEEGIAYLGCTEDSSEISTYGIDLGGSTSYSHKFTFGKTGDEYKDDTFTGKYAFSGSLDLKLEASAKVYISWGETYFEIKLNVSAKFVADFSAEAARKSVPLANFEISPIAGVYVRLKPAFIIEGKGQCKSDITFSWTTGFKASTNSGKQNLTSNPKVSLNSEATVTIFIGFSLEPELVVLHEKIANASLKGEAGVEIKATVVKASTDSKGVQHECESCIDGDISAKVNLTASIKLLNKESMKYDFKMVDVTVHLMDFYYSFDFNEFGFKECPHYLYRVDVLVIGDKLNFISGADVNGILTDEDGKATLYFANGESTVTVKKEGYPDQTRKVMVKSKPTSTCFSLGTWAGAGTGGVSPVITLNDVTSGSGNNDDNNDKDDEYDEYDNTTLTEGDFTYEIKDGEATLTKYTGADSRIVIPASIKNRPVTSIGGYAFYGCSGLTSVTIPDSVTTIRESAFSVCSGLTSITLPDGVTSIGSHAFYGCSGLTSVTIPDGVTSIGDGAFRDCSSLTSITIPDSVTSIGHDTFHGCTSLTSITIPDSVTSIGYDTFHGCTSLTSITIPDGVTSIGDGAFQDCTSLTSITIPDSVTSIGHDTFHGCTSLTSITIPDSVTSIGSYAFDGCSGLTSITIPDGVTSIGKGAFYGCSGLTSVTIPDGVTSIIWQTFYGCSSLTSITIPDGVTSIESYAFGGCFYLTIYGISGSYAETYAKNNSIPFVSLNNSVSLIETAANVQYLSPIYDDAPYASAGIQTAACSGLIPNEIYNFYVMADKAAENALSPTNLLFVSQTRTDAGGNLSVTYGYSTAIAEPQILLKPMNPINISGAQMTVPNLTDHGVTQFAKPTVTYLGEALAEDRDYTIISGDEVTSAGNYTFTIEGTGDYTGTLSVNYTVYPRTSVTTRSGNASVSLNWNPIADASQYAVLFCKKGGKFTLNSYTDEIQQTVTGLTNGTEYYFVVLSKIGEDWTTFMVTDSVSAVPEGQSVLGESVKGAVKIYGANAATVTVELLDESGTVIDTVNSADGNYSFSGTENGKYSIRVSKSKYAPRTYPVTIGATTITLDAELRLYGDIDGDGFVGASDATQILRYTNGLSSVFDQDDEALAAYLLAVGNVFDDGELDAADATQILRHENELSSVFDEIQ